MRIRPETQNRQRGMAAFAVTTALILIISLIVMGYSLVTRRAQQQTLDRQLGQQATLAAESGVNMAAAVLNDQVAMGNIPQQKLTCDDDANYPDVVLGSDNVKVTCLIVKVNPGTLEYSNVTDGSPTVVPISSTSALTQLTLTWRNTDGSTGSSGCDVGATGYARPTVDAWGCSFGILRVDFAARSDGNANAFARTAFFYPTNQSTTPTHNVTSLDGSWRNAACQGGSCSVTITGLTVPAVAVGGSPAYYLAARSLYKDSSLSVSGYSGMTNATFNGQAVVDSTARAGDVVKRVQVRVPAEGGIRGSSPGYSIESSGSLCKKYVTAPSRYTNWADASCTRNP